MKRIALLFAFLFTFSSAFISCRETEREADDVELEEGLEDAEEGLEDAGNEIEEEID